MNGVISIQNRRAVSQVIGTMLILSVTVAGAVFLSNLMSNEFFAVDQHPVAESRIDSIRLTSYDTRDSVELTNVPNLNNTFNQMLCTKGDSAECTIINVDNLPSDFVNPVSTDQGTEFIVLQIRNMNIDSVFIHNILINNVGHTWDEFAVGDLVLTNNIGSGGNYPRAGTFSIIPVENDPPIKQLATNEIPGDGEVRLVIKLSDNIPQDIGMWSSLRVLVNFGGSQPTEFIILSGDAKW
jgi:FlaG/FlaF family flagellin (archaellin)